MQLKIAISSMTGLLLAAASFAGESAYVCEVSNVYGLSEIQTLTTLPAIATELKKHKISVSRATGQVIAESTVDTSKAKEVRVLSKGSRENAFRAIADFGVFPNGARPFRLLEIQEFAAGPLKPFLLVTEIGVVTGTCK
jgi:hypothetical protein